MITSDSQVKFKIGDRVVRIKEDWEQVKLGQVYTISRLDNRNGCVFLEELGFYAYDAEYFKLYEEETMKQVTCWV